MRLMRASRATSIALLCGYPLVHHEFQFDSIASLRRSYAFYSRYQLRITRLRLSADFNSPLLDSSTGRSVLPDSLISLSIGEEWAADCTTRWRKEAQERWTDQAEGWCGAAGGKQRSVEEVRRAELRRRFELCRDWNVEQRNAASGDYNQPLPPGALPPGLRLLHLCDSFNQPLSVGSIPDSVEFLQLGWSFNQVLQEGHLPASLKHLVIGKDFTSPLHSGVLPAGLQRLHLGGAVAYIHPGALPPQLRQLSFGWRHTQPITPGLIPSSVTHVRLSDSYKLPLQAGSIPHGVVHLDVGDAFNQPLPAGVLPPSLRELVLGERYDRPLDLGSLPHGLEVMLFREPSSFSHWLEPGVIPASVRLLSVARLSRQELAAGHIPATVQWLRLSDKYMGRDLSHFVSPATHVDFWRGIGG